MSYIPEPVTRIDKYLAYIAGNMDVALPDHPITRKEHYLAAWAEKSGFEDVDVTGEPPLTLENAIGKPLKGLKLYGKSTQMTTTGAQLIDINSFQKNNNFSVKIVNNYSIELTSTVEKDASDSRKVYLNVTINADILVGKTITMSYDGWNSNVPNEAAVCGIMYNINGENNYESILSDSRIKTVTIPLSAKDCKVRLFLIETASATVKAGTYTAIIKGLMVCEGTVAKSWEPYTGGKPSPSPDYPQEIVSAGEDGSIGVEVHGKNIFGGRYYYAMYSNGVLFIDKGRKDEEVKFPYQPKAETLGICKVLKCQKGKTYVISVTNPNKNATIGMAEYENIENAFREINAVGFAQMVNKTKQLYIAKSDGVLVCGIAGTWTDGKSTTHECTESELLQVEEASEATTYEPYHEPQSMSVTTPNGLPGIPVSSGGNYTDEHGQQWVCDEVDLGRGVYVQRIARFMINDKNANDIFVTNLYTHVTVAVNARIRVPEETSNSSEMRRNRNLFCEALPWTADEWSSTVNSMGFVENGMVDFTVENSYLGLSEASTNDERKAALVKYFTDKPCQIIYRIATPIETPLTSDQLAAYKALHTYKGTTIIDNDAGAYMSVRYEKMK